MIFDMLCDQAVHGRQEALPLADAPLGEASALLSLIVEYIRVCVYIYIYIYTYNNNNAYYYYHYYYH